MTTTQIHKMSSRVLDGLKSYSLSNFDLKHLDPNIKITLSDDLPHIRFADELVNQQGIGILLWQFGPNAKAGHWLGLIRSSSDNTFEVFNSYGGSFSSINKQLQIGNGGATPSTLTSIIKSSGYRLIAPSHRFQAKRADDNTCGRWVALRLLFHRYDISEFRSILSTISRELGIHPLDLAILNSIG
jgi:hypothetical protein